MTTLSSKVMYALALFLMAIIAMHLPVEAAVPLGMAGAAFYWHRLSASEHRRRQREQEDEVPLWI